MALTLATQLWPTRRAAWQGCLGRQAGRVGSRQGGGGPGGVAVRVGWLAGWGGGRVRWRARSGVARGGERAGWLEGGWNPIDVRSKEYSGVNIVT